MRLSEERMAVLTDESNLMSMNDAQGIEDANEEGINEANMSQTAKDVKKSMEYVVRLMNSSFASSSSNILEMELFHDKIKNIISVLDPNSGARVQRR